MDLARVAPGFVLAASLLGLGGCDRLASYISKKADEKVAEEIDSASDALGDDEAPSGKKTKSRKKKPKEDDGSGVADSKAPATPPIPTVPDLGGIPVPPVATPSVDYFADASSIPKSVDDRAGAKARIEDVSIFAGYAVAKVVDPADLEHAHLYRLSNGTVDSVVQVPLAPKPSAAELEKTTFAVGDADFTVVGAMVKDAPKRVGLPDAIVSHVILERDVAFNEGKLLYRVYVANGEKRAEYDAKGKWLANH